MIKDTYRSLHTEQLGETPLGVGYLGCANDELQALRRG